MLLRAFWFDRLMKKLKENVRVKRKNKLFMLKATCVGKRLKKVRWFASLQSFCLARKENRKKVERVSKFFKRQLKKRAFLGLLFLDGVEQREKILKKKIFSAFKALEVIKLEKGKFYEQYMDGYFWRLAKRVFKRWRVFRVKCLRRRKQLVRVI